MSTDSQALQPGVEAPEPSEAPESEGGGGKSSTFTRVAKYTSVKLIMQFFAVVIGVYLTIMIANMGGYVDSIMRGQIRENLAQQMLNDPNFKAMDQSQRQKYMATLVEQEEQRLGLDQPFVIRSFRFLWNSLRVTTE